MAFHVEIYLDELFVYIRASQNKLASWEEEEKKLERLIASLKWKKSFVCAAIETQMGAI